MSQAFTTAIESYSTLHAHGVSTAARIAHEEKLLEHYERTIKDLDAERREKETRLHALDSIIASLTQQISALREDISTGEQFAKCFSMNSAVHQQDDEDFGHDQRRDHQAEKLQRRARRASDQLRKLGEERALSAAQRELDSTERPDLSLYLKATGSLLRLMARLRSETPGAHDDATKLHSTVIAHPKQRLAERACSQLDALAKLPHHPPLLTEAYERARTDAAEARTATAGGRTQKRAIEGDEHASARAARGVDTASEEGIDCNGAKQSGARPLVRRRLSCPS